MLRHLYIVRLVRHTISSLEHHGTTHCWRRACHQHLARSSAVQSPLSRRVCHGSSRTMLLSMRHWTNRGLFHAGVQRDPGRGLRNRRLLCRPPFAVFMWRWRRMPGCVFRTSSCDDVSLLLCCYFFRSVCRAEYRNSTQGIIGVMQLAME